MMTEPKPFSSTTVRFLARSHQQLIGGLWRDGNGAAPITVENPATGMEIAHLSSSNAADVDAAVLAARVAFDGAWGSMPAADKGLCLLRLADLVERHADELAEIEVAENGMAYQLAHGTLTGFCVPFLRYYAGWTTKISGMTLPGEPAMRPGLEWLTYTLREPVGVVGAIIPWNAPSSMLVLKVAPALAAGCTLVLKPADLTPLGAVRFAELIEEAGFPAGTFNLVQGGAEVGRAMVRHRGISKISFTGSTAVGQEIVREAAYDLKRVSLELGGKSPVIVYPDANLDEAIPGAAMACFFMSGQNCMGGTRLFVEESIHDAFVDGMKQVTSFLPVANGMAENALIGPLISAKQRARVQGFCDGAIEAGATLALGGGGIGGAGYFFEPTIFTNVTPDMALAREEVFGPVLAVQKFSANDEASMLRAVNDTQYGLSGSVWTRDLATAHRIAKRIDSGQVSVNAHAAIAPETPFGGNKQSGWGREFGAEGLDAYLKTKAVTINLGPANSLG